MPAKKRSSKGKKTRSRTRGTTSKASRNWSRIKQQWFESPLSLEAFLRSKKIPLSTGKKHLSVAEKNEFLEHSSDAAEKFRRDLAELVGKDEGRLYVQSLKHVTAAVQEVLLDSAQSFKQGHGYMTQEKAGRLVIAAGDMLLRTSQELQGIPDEDEVDGWPLSRLFSPFSYQRDFVHDTPLTCRLEERLPDDGSEDPFIFAFIGGRGAGKTFVGAQKAGQLAWLNRGKVGMVLAPTYGMLRDGAKANFLKACTDKGLTFKHLKTENAIILFGDTKVLFRSMDEPDRIRGNNLAWAWLDEPGQLPDREAFDIVNGCIRGDDKPEKAMVLTSTPDGLNWLYDVVVTEADENRVRLYRARSQDNPVLGDFERRLRASYDPRFAAQELDAEFLNIFSGQAYWNYSAVESVFDPKQISLDENLPIDLCCDFNVSPMCWNISQDIVGRDGQVYTYVFDEIHLDTAGTDITAQEFVDRYGQHKAALRAGVRIWGDASGQHRSTSASRHDYEIIEQRLKKAEIPVDVNIGRSNPRQRDRVLSVNARLLSATGVRRLFISSRCKYTKIDFERTAFVPGTQQLDKSDSIGSQGSARKKKRPQLTHHTDAIGYKIFRTWPVRGAVVSAPTRAAA